LIFRAAFLAALDLDFVGQNDPDMAGAFADRAGASSSLWLKALRGGSLPNDGLLDDEVGDVQVVVILGIGDGAGKRLADEACGLLGHKAEQIEGIRGRKSLNLPRDLTRFEGGDPGKRYVDRTCIVVIFLGGCGLSSPGVHF
jgi:hypothetical protein